MPEVCSYTIGNLSIALIPDLLEGTYDVPGKFDGFRTLGAADISLNIHFTQPSEIPFEKMIYDRGLSWCLYHSKGSLVLRFRSPKRDPRVVGVFSQDFRSGDIFVGLSETDPDRFIFPLGFPMGEVYISNLLGAGLGVILHSCGVIYQEKGLLFSGAGGAGKSTTARLWMQQDGVQVVNDDRVIVRKIGGQFRLYGTPWHGVGGMALAEDAPLSRIFLLKQAKSNQIRPLSPTQAATALLARSFSPFWSNEGLKFTLQFLADLCREIPVFEYSFLPDQSAVDFICNLVDGKKR